MVLITTMRLTGLSVRIKNTEKNCAEQANETKELNIPAMESDIPALVSRFARYAPEMIRVTNYSNAASKTDAVLLCLY